MFHSNIMPPPCSMRSTMSLAPVGCAICSALKVGLGLAVGLASGVGLPVGAVGLGLPVESGPVVGVGDAAGPKVQAVSRPATAAMWKSCGRSKRAENVVGRGMAELTQGCSLRFRPRPARPCGLPRIRPRVHSAPVREAC